MADASVTALRRFGLGPRPGERARIQHDPRGFVLAQLSSASVPGVPGELASSAEFWTAYHAYIKEARAATPPPNAPSNAPPGGPAAPTAEAAPDAMMAAPPKPERRRPPQTGILQRETKARVDLAIATDTPFLERLTAFWANHFCVSTKKNSLLWGLAGAYEREAIRPHVLGRFRDMLQAVVHHPAMLIYLDNVRSYGPNSPVGRHHKRGFNENLAREILELHTLGVNGGYTQADVGGLASALTGWTVAGLDAPVPGAFVFDERRHEPAAVTVLGTHYPNSGVLQAEAILDSLARHPATATHLSRKLAVHFVGEAAPAALIERLATAFRDTGGNLREVARALISADEAWDAPARKVLPPYDLLVATYRALGSPPNDRFVLKTLTTFGQPMWGVDSPAGWPQEDTAWAAPAALAERIDWAEQVAAAAETHLPRNLADLAGDLLGSALTPETRTAIARAESRRQAAVLLILSPEFQRR